MTRRAVRLTEDIVGNDGVPVVLKGSLGLFSGDETAVVFPTALVSGGTPVFTAAFIDSLAHKTEPADPADLSEEMLAFDFGPTIPIRGWGLR